MKNLELRIKKEKTKAIRHRFSILCVSILFCSVAMADSLKFKFAPGDKYSLVSVTEQKVSQMVDANERTIEQTTRLECDFDMEEVDESGTAWAKYTYKRVTMKIRSPEQKINFDSDSNQLKAPMQAMPLRLAIGESLYLRVTPQGRIEKINGIQPLITYAKGKMANFQGADIVSRNIELQFSEQEIRRTLEDQLAVFPDSNQGGTTWSRVEVLSPADVGSPKMDKVEDVNIVSEKIFRQHSEISSRGVVIVDVNLIMKPAPVSVINTSASEQDITTSVRVSREISGGGTGRIEIEEATGRIINYTMTQDTAEKAKFASQGPMLRLPPAPEPIISNVVTTFQMTKVEGTKPAQPADTNKNGSPATRPS